MYMSQSATPSSTAPEPEFRSASPASAESLVMPAELAKDIRKIAHDLSNSLEVIVQTSYLLTLAELKEPATEWLRMLDGGVQRALELNQQLREYVKTHAPK
jgi:signal transduction histidine kinase